MEIIQQRIQQIVADREHGSRWLVREAIKVLHDLAQEPAQDQTEQLRQIYTSAYQLAHARPAMAALSSAVSRIISVYKQGPTAIAQEAQKLLDDYDTATQRIAQYAQPFLQGHIMTCSISGTVLETLFSHKEQIEEVTVLEGRPRYEGRETARQLSTNGIAVTLITDAQADIFLPTCQCVVVGADSILINGDVLNKAGTSLLAWDAHGRDIPFYVLSETLKISPNRWYEHDHTHIADNLKLLEEKEPEEVLEQPIPGVKVRNFYFDHTTYRHVTSVITEQGSLDRRHIREIAVSTRANMRLLEKLQKQ